MHPVNYVLAAPSACRTSSVGYVYRHDVFSVRGDAKKKRSAVLPERAVTGRGVCIL